MNEEMTTGVEKDNPDSSFLSWKKIFYGSAGLLILAVAAGYLFIPPLAASFIKPMLEQSMEKQGGGSASIDEMTLERFVSPPETAADGHVRGRNGLRSGNFGRRISDGCPAWRISRSFQSRTTRTDPASVIERTGEPGIVHAADVVPGPLEFQ